MHYVNPKSLIGVPAQAVSMHPLAQWAHSSEKGERREYFRGDLAVERGKAAIDEICRGTRQNLRAQRLERLGEANMAFELAVEGLVHLVQERVGEHESVYVMVSRGRGTLRQVTPVGRLASAYMAEMAGMSTGA